MNESLDLRNRILKMRESNNLALSHVKPDGKDKNFNPEIIAHKIENNDHNKKESIKVRTDNVGHETDTKNKSYSVESEKIIDTNLFKQKSTNSSIKFERYKNKETLNGLVNNNEAQFRIIANKFNEAVEVILELSEKVKRLEGIVNNLPVNNVKNKKKNSFFKINTYIFIILTILFILGISTFKIDLSIVQLIITDIISSI